MSLFNEDSLNEKALIFQSRLGWTGFGRRYVDLLLFRRLTFTVKGPLTLTLRQ